MHVGRHHELGLPVHHDIAAAEAKDALLLGIHGRIRSLVSGVARVDERLLLLLMLLKGCLLLILLLIGLLLHVLMLLLVLLLILLLLFLRWRSRVCAGCSCSCCHRLCFTGWRLLLLLLLLLRSVLFVRLLTCICVCICICITSVLSHDSLLFRLGGRRCWRLRG